jgi:predicted porin
LPRVALLIRSLAFDRRATPLENRSPYLQEVAMKSVTALSAARRGSARIATRFARHGASGSLVALLLAAAYGGASAQSSVTVFGTVDIGGRYVTANGQPKRWLEETDGLNNSQLGFTGREDLGGGLFASFMLLSGINPDTGTTNPKFWNRRSTVSLISPWGELRLGRDYVPTFWNLGLADPFGATGIGSVANVHQMYEGVRQDNSIGYFLPGNLLGGLYGQAMVSSSENGTSGDRPARYIGGRIGYASGPFDFGIAGAQRRYAITTVVGTIPGFLVGVIPGAIAQPGDTQKTYNGWGSWKFSFATFTASWDREELRDVREDIGTLGAVIPIGVGEIHVSYDRSTLKNSIASGSTNTVDQFALGGAYNASKRTAIYATFARLNNKDQSRLTLFGNAGLTTPGGHSQGFEFGLRHFF